MQRPPLMVLICGVLTTGLGVVLLVMSGQVAGLAWLAAAVAVLGAALVALWLRAALRRSDPRNAPLPGSWYPYAMIGIGLALGCWLIYWAKVR
jgi:drug/metabolite transporter (DMT)-like permease